MVPVPPALYVPRGMMGNLPNHCDQIGALDAGNGTWLLLLTRDNRPSYPVLDAVLFNPQTMTVTDVQRGIGVRSGLGGIKTERLVLRQNGEPQHYAVRLISDYIENADCDCADAFIEGWLRLFTDNEHIRQEWIQ